MEVLSPTVPVTAVDPAWRPRFLCIDADGVLHRGPRVLPGAIELLALLDRRKIPYRVVTNNSRELAATCAAHYRHLGLPVPTEVVFTAADAMAAYVRAEHAYGRPRVYPLGESALYATFRAYGCRIAIKRADYVAVGLDRRLTFRRLARACSLVSAGARLVAANRDPTIPTEGGQIPGAGALTAAVETATGVQATVIGKPAPEMFVLAVQSMGARPDEVIHLGDRLDSDILGAVRAGLRSALVLTGSHTREDIPRAEAAPDYVFDDLPMFLAWCDGGPDGPLRP